MNLNGDKCQQLLFTNQESDLSTEIDNETIAESKVSKLLGLKLGRALSSEPHLDSKTKIHVLSRICNYLVSEKLQIVMRVFILYKLNNFPLV